MTNEKVETKQINTKERKTVKDKTTVPISGVSKAPRIKTSVKSFAGVPPEQNATKENVNLVATLNNFNANKTHNRLYSGYANNPITTHSSINGSELANAVCTSLKNRTDISEIFVAIHNTLSEKLSCAFTGFGLYHETSKCIDFKLFSNWDKFCSLSFHVILSSIMQMLSFLLVIIF